MGYRTGLIFLLLVFLGGCVNTKLSHLRHERFHYAEKDFQALATRTKVPDKPLALNDIIEIAICNNLDLRVKELEYAIQSERATGEKLKTLPSLTLSGEHSYRSTNTASYSINATTGEISSGVDPVTGQALPPGSIGSSQWVNRWDLTAAYNLVDFGLSYLRARQEINRAISVRFQYERARQNLILDIFKAYWKTLAAKQTMDQAAKLTATSRKLQSNVENWVSAKMIPEISGLRSQLELVNMRARLQPIENSYQQGKTELAALMGIPDSTEFEIADVEIDLNLFELDDMELLEERALQNRPELYSSDAEHHIFKDEVRAALVEMFPNTSIFGGQNYDYDRFLINHHWFLSGARTAWNLLSLPQKWYNRKAAKERVKLSHESRMALSLGVITQVHLAYFTYLDALKSYENLDETSAINSRMLFIANKQREYGALDGIDMINFDVDALESQYNALVAYGDIQIALELLNNAMGLPLHYSKVPKTQESCDTCSRS